MDRRTTKDTLHVIGMRDPFKIPFISIANGRVCRAEFTEIIIVIQLKREFSVPPTASISEWACYDIFFPTTTVRPAKFTLALHKLPIQLQKAMERVKRIYQNKEEGYEHDKMLLICLRNQDMLYRLQQSYLTVLLNCRPRCRSYW